MSTLGRGGIRDCIDVTFFDVSTGTPVLFLDSLKMTTTEVGAETVYARGGRGNPRRIGWDGSKDVSIDAQDCLISPEALALHLGTSVTTGAQYVPVTYLATGISATTFQLPSTPYTGATPTYPLTLNLNSNNDGSTLGTSYTYAATPTGNQFSVSAAGLVTLGSTPTNQNFIVTYYRQTSANNKRITVDADKFPGTYKITGYTLWRDEQTGKDFPCRLTVPRAKLLAPFSIEQKVDGEPSVFEMKLDVLKPAGSQSMIIYDIEADSPIN